MCVLAFAWRAHPRWPLVLAGNRDEAHDRPAAPLARWPGAPGVLAGRDLVGGGAWLGAAEAGRLAVVVNLSGFGPPDPKAPSRGALVSDVLTGAPAPPDLRPYNPFALIVVADGRARLLANRPVVRHEALASGLHGLSNGPLDAPWPKVLRVKAALAAWLTAGDDSLTPLFDALADRTDAVFVDNPRYGTRCSTVVAVNAEGAGHIEERRFDARARPTGATALSFSWPWST